MNILELEPRAKKVTFDMNDMWVELQDGRKIGVPLAYFLRLKNASPVQRKKYTISGGGVGLHWDGLDEDISVPALLLGRVDKTITPRQSRKAA
ncbi:MAG: DUF2442 domain-containing protein [Pyrinomonadaceae bacterium]